VPGHSHEREQRARLGGRADRPPVGQGGDDGGHIGGVQQRAALVQLVAQHIGVQADSPGQLLLGPPGRTAALTHRRTESLQILHPDPLDI
jgi:hypothetical protein